MQGDAPRLADTVAWLRRAALDLRAAEVDLAAIPALLGDAAFHCQQATEKVLKGFLIWHDVPFRRTHDLAEIGQQCSAFDISIEPTCRRAERLTAYAWIFRYPGDVEETHSRRGRRCLEPRPRGLRGGSQSPTCGSSTHSMSGSVCVPNS